MIGPIQPAAMVELVQSFQPIELVELFEIFEIFDFWTGGGMGGTPPLSASRRPDPDRRLGILQESRPIRGGK